LATWVLYAAYLTWRMRSVLPYSLREGAQVLGLGLLFLPLVLLRASWVVNVSLYGLFIAGYSAILVATQVVTRSELAELRQAATARAAEIAVAQD